MWARMTAGGLTQTNDGASDSNSSSPFAVGDYFDTPGEKELYT